MRGVSQHVRSDNGSEFIALAIQKWLAQVGVKTLYIAPGSPWENGYAESFHSRLRDEFLALEESENVAAARKLATAWQEDYNRHRPHSSLGYLTPVGFAARHGESPVATRWAASAPELASATPQPTPPLHRGGDPYESPEALPYSREGKVL